MTPKEIIANVRRSGIGQDDADKWAEALILQLAFEGYEIRRKVPTRPVLHSPSLIDEQHEAAWREKRRLR